MLDLGRERQTLLSHATVKRSMIYTTSRTAQKAASQDRRTSLHLTVARQ